MTEPLRIILTAHNPAPFDLEVPWRVLLVDNVNDAKMATELLTQPRTDMQFAVTHVESLSEAITRLSMSEFDVVALDLQLPDSIGLDTFLKLHAAMPELPVVIVTEQDEQQMGMAAVANGAQDYVVKNTQTYGEVLVRSLQYAIHRKRAELASNDAVVRAERRFRGLVESAPDAVVIFDAAGRIVLVNSRTEKMFGCSREEIIGESADVLVPERFANYVKSFFNDTGKGTLDTVLEIYAIRKDGSEFPVEMNLRPLETDEGVLVSSAIRDTTERKTAEQRLSEFYAILAHELRTPLASIQGSLDLIEARRIGPEQEKELLAIAGIEARRMLRLINDLLDLKKIEAGETKLNLVPLKAKQIVDKAIDSLRGMAMESQVAVVANVTSDPRLFCDEDRIIQVLTNLLSNAIKYSPADGVVEIAVKPNQTDIKFAVTDAGPGISETDLDKLFQQYNQGTRTSGRFYASTGLGLSIAKKIVEQHGGKIGVETKDGAGSTLWFTLPRKPQVEGIT